MSTTQVRLTIPTKLKDLATIHASRYGLTLAGYIKNLLIQDTKMTYPIKHPSDSTIQAIKEGNEEYRLGKTKKLPLDNLDEFLANL